jgi:predicted aconitase
LYLTKAEENTLNGEHGWANQIAMKILVKLGDLYGAAKLIPVQSAHLSGVSYKHLGDAAIEFLNELANQGGKARTLATLNPSSFDPKNLVKRYAKERCDKQRLILELYEKMGIELTLTCTPYYLRKPEAGKHLAWAESSAIVYANSVLNAWTNREGSPSALAAALIGKTPNYGFHQPENREPNVFVKIETPLRTEADYGATGIHLGKLLKDKIPTFQGLHASEEELKNMGAAMASSGMTAMFHKAMPEQKRQKLETVSVETKDITDVVASLSSATKPPKLVFIGCPHCSINELKNVAMAIEGKKIRKGTELWVCTSKYLKNRARKHVDTIEKAGGHVLCDTCVLVTWIKDLGVRSLMTNSAKTAFYAPTLNEVEVTFSPLKQCIQAACRA